MPDNTDGSDTRSARGGDEEEAAAASAAARDMSIDTDIMSFLMNDESGDLDLDLIFNSLVNERGLEQSDPEGEEEESSDEENERIRTMSERRRAGEELRKAQITWQELIDGKLPQGDVLAFKRSYSDIDWNNGAYLRAFEHAIRDYKVISFKHFGFLSRHGVWENILPSLATISDEKQLDMSASGVINGQLFRWLATNAMVVKLMLECNEVGEEDLADLVEVLRRNTHLRHLGFYLNEIKDYQGVLGPAVATSTTLQVLDLSSNYLSKVGSAALATCLKTNTSLLILKVGLDQHEMKYNFDEWILPYAKALKENDKLRELHLCGTAHEETPAGYYTLVASREEWQTFFNNLNQNESLEILELDLSLDLTSQQSEGLALGIRENTSLKTLKLHVLGLYDTPSEALLPIARAVKFNVSLKSLIIDYYWANQEHEEYFDDEFAPPADEPRTVSDETLEAFLEALKYNTEIEVLDIPLDRAGKRRVKRRLRINKLMRETDWAEVCMDDLVDALVDARDHEDVLFELLTKSPGVLASLALGSLHGGTSPFKREWYSCGLATKKQESLEGATSWTCP